MDTEDHPLYLARNQLELSSDNARLRDALATLATAEAALRQVTASRDEVVRQYAYLPNRSVWQLLLFRSDGRPVKLLRRLLFREGGKPRRFFQSFVLNSFGRPRRAFRQWMSSIDYLSLPEAVRVADGRAEQDSEPRPVWQVQIDPDAAGDADIDELMELIRAELAPSNRS